MAGLWRVLVALCGVGVALRLASAVDRLAERWQRHRATARGCPGRSCVEAGEPTGVAAAGAAPTSDILAVASGAVPILLAPQPRHPRPIEGAVVRVRPPIPLYSVATVALMMAMATPEHAKRQGERPS